jgi:hypothetical protein
MSYWKQTEIIDAAGNLAQIAPGGEITVVEPTRLAGSSFSGPSLDANFWTFTLVGTGTATQANDQVVLATGATANSSAAITSVESARFIGESLNRYSGIIQLGDTGTANNIRRWGMFNGTDGIYFMLSGTTMNVATMKGGVETAVPSASWNQSTTVPTLTNANIYRIVYGDLNVFFYINNVLVHKVSFSTTPPTNTINLPNYLGNTNSGGSTSNVSITARVSVTQRLGKFETQPKYYHITVAGTYTLKNVAGTLHKIVMNNAGGTLVTVYDNTTATAPIIAVINTPSQANPVTLMYDLAFSTGLTIVTTGTWDLTIIYQ